MIPIKKDPQPNELLRYRKSPYSSYEDMPGDVKTVVKKQLMEEQGCLCAYCMSRLPRVESLGDKPDGVTIEHWAPRNPSENEDPCDSLDYRNMLAVCSGNRGSGRLADMTCDAARGNKPLYVNPLQEETLAGIYYSSQGEIHSANPLAENDLVRILNLNCQAVSLPQRRKATLDAFLAELNKRCGDKKAAREWLQKALNRYENEGSTKTPFVGILLWWLKKRIQR